VCDLLWQHALPEILGVDIHHVLAVGSGEGGLPRQMLEFEPRARHYAREMKEQSKTERLKRARETERASGERETENERENWNDLGERGGRQHGLALRIHRLGIVANLIRELRGVPDKETTQHKSP
jgi:hypothetical protein